MIRVVCPTCEQAVSFGDHLAGFTVQCPQCRGTVDVPATSAAEITSAPPAGLDAAALRAVQLAIDPGFKAAEPVEQPALPVPTEAPRPGGLLPDPEDSRG